MTKRKNGYWEGTKARGGEQGETKTCGRGVRERVELKQRPVMGRGRVVSWKTSVTDPLL